MAYNSQFTGAQIDEAIADVRSNKDTWNGKQDVILASGASVGDMIKVKAVDASGKPTAWAVAVAGKDYLKTAPVTSVNGKTGDVTVSGTKVTQYSGTLLANSWTEDAYGYQAQTITITGLKASYDVDPQWDVALSGTDPDADAALLEGFALIHNYTTGANSLTAQCIGAAPTVNIPVKVVAFG